MVAGRWKSPAMVSRYAEGTAAGRGAVARYHRGGMTANCWESSPTASCVRAIQVEDDELLVQ